MEYTWGLVIFRSDMPSILVISRASSLPRSTRNRYRMAMRKAKQYSSAITAPPNI